MNYKVKFNNLVKKAKTRLNTWLTPVPEIQEDYVDKVVYLLRRDFDVKTQNEILLSIGKKLSELREQDMRKLEENYKVLQENHTVLNSRMAF